MNTYYTTTNAASRYINSAFTRPTYSWTTSNTAAFATDCTGTFKSWIDGDYVQKMIAQQKEKEEREALRQADLLSSFEEVFA